MKELWYSSGASVLVVLVSGIFDISLKLGDFHGLVFFLYSWYGLAAVALILLGTAVYTKKKVWAYAIIVPAVVAAVLYLIATLVQ